MALTTVLHACPVRSEAKAGVSGEWSMVNGFRKSSLKCLLQAGFRRVNVKEKQRVHLFFCDYSLVFIVGYHGQNRLKCLLYKGFANVQHRLA